MKKILISAAIFIIMIIGMLFSMSYLSKVNKELIGLSDSLEKQINSNQWEQAYASSLQLTDQWKEHCSIISIYVHHAEIDNIDNELWKLSQYTKCESLDESLASIHVIKFFINHIFNLEKVNIQNIF